MPNINEEAYQDLVKAKEENAEYHKTNIEVVKLLLAAAECGYVDENQKDAIIFALERLTRNDHRIMEALMKVPIIGMPRKKKNGKD